MNENSTEPMYFMKMKNMKIKLYNHTNENIHATMLYYVKLYKH
jgi:hypothetical protein